MAFLSYYLEVCLKKSKFSNLLEPQDFNPNLKTKIRKFLLSVFISQKTYFFIIDNFHHTFPDFYFFKINHRKIGNFMTYFVGLLSKSFCGHESRFKITVQSLMSR